jgi:hypothetical protein
VYLPFLNPFKKTPAGELALQPFQHQTPPKAISLSGRGFVYIIVFYLYHDCGTALINFQPDLLLGGQPVTNPV